jgi:hypothetical protein
VRGAAAPTLVCLHPDIPSLLDRRLTQNRRQHV